MKRARPRQHTRLIKTKKGRKKILVNKGIKRKKNYGGGILFENSLRKKGIDIKGTKSEKKKITKQLSKFPWIAKDIKPVKIHFKKRDPWETKRYLGKFSENTNEPSSREIKLNPLLKLGTSNIVLAKDGSDQSFPYVLLHEAGHAQKSGQDFKESMVQNYTKEKLRNFNKGTTKQEMKQAAQDILNSAEEDRADRYSAFQKMKRDKIVKNYGSFFHGTSEESLAKMGLTGGLTPRKGKLYLSDDPKYARFKGRQSVEGTKFKPVVIEVDDPGDLVREGRHFVSRKKIPIRKFKKIELK